MSERHHQIVIIGAGAAGISVAASLMRQAEGKSLDIVIIDPAQTHYYQPEFTLVGGGVIKLDKTRRPMKGLIPDGVPWIQQAASAIDPDSQRVSLQNGDIVAYDYLVVCPGLVLDYDAIEGLRQALGKNGVCSNYSPDYVEYTWQCIQALKAGDKAFFSQAPLPIKCPGAPQKIAYLAADHLRRQGILADCELHFTSPAPSMFGVPYFAKALVKVADGYGIHKDLLHKLVKVDGEAKKATFEIVDGEHKGELKELEFDMLHVTPHQTTPALLHGSAVSNEAGYVEVDQHSLQHVKYPNVFSLGDACSTPNSKTAAAVRKQSPVVVKNMRSLIAGETLAGRYNGYGSCPLTTARGKVMMAEFIYGGKVTPTLAYIAKPNVESAIMWQVKTKFLPLLYWNYMLKGYEKFIEPQYDFDIEE
ncbi:pyridine nucleotide-disulfide oxidoreductase [Cycloclasticus sp. 46_83_sub15_T18]|nr:pyridine nucleotide-disulfide oxidoreductase [Cycloclasticus sp. 46_83_sub15_T18]